ncbi:MAG: ABC transporter permease [Tissierellia bacterium]|nr:ABC transporter permease [Tissierellia bacterium]
MENKANDKFSFYKVDDSVSEVIAAPEYSYWKSVYRKFISSKVAIFMFLLLVAVLLMSIIHPMFSKFSNLNNVNINDKSQWFLRPSAEHWFGTDDVGQDMFDMVWAGAKTSLFIAFTATFFSTTIGVIVGMFWGFSKKVDAIMIQVYNVVANIPFMLIVMVLSFALGAGVAQLIFALSCTTWIGTAYFIRVQVMIIRDREYNLASRCLGSSTTKMVFHNVLPYLVSVIVTSVSREVPSFISYEVFLSYVGVGLSSDIASLGKIVQDNAQYMQSAAYLFIIPLIVTALISVSLYIVGQTLADASDPRNHMI